MDPASKSEHVLRKFNKSSRPVIFHQGNRVLFESVDRSAFIVLDLTDGRSVKISPSVSISRCLTIEEDLIVYLKKNTLYFLNLRTGKELKREKIKKASIFNAAWFEKKLLILSSRYLYTYYPGNNKLEKFRLPDRPSSPFLCKRDSIYYGNTARELVKMSLSTRKVKWQHKISKKLKVQPHWINQHIMVLSEDNNIYFFTTAGSLHWWQKLESPRLSAPVVMAKSIGVLLRPALQPTIKFFNSLEKSVVSFKWEKKIYWQSQPLYFNESIYIILQEKEGQPFYLSSIGNRYDVEIQTTPKEILPVHQSIKFDLKPVNLIKPEYQITLTNINGKKVLLKKISKKQLPHFIWIPDKSGSYQLSIEVQASNIKNLKISQSIEIKDIEALINFQIFQRQKACQFDTIFKKK